jgi:uncharacterized membrane-anchored protein YjiN (DUF445 family)
MIYAVHRKLKAKIIRLRREIDNTPIDPRSGGYKDKLRNIDAEIEQYNDELKILRRHKKMQGGTLTNLNDDPNMAKRTEGIKEDLTKTKNETKLLDKECRDLKINSQLVV